MTAVKAVQKGRPPGRLNAGLAPHLAPRVPLFSISGKHAAGVHLEDMKDEMIVKAKAAQAAYGPLVLASWYTVQLADVRARVADLEGKLERNLVRMEGADDPKWPKLWLQQAKYAYLAQRTEDRLLGRGTLPRLEEAGHILVCPWHGVDGDVFADLAPEHWEGLSFLGVLEGGLETHASWQRYCASACAADTLERMARQFQREWEAKHPRGKNAGLTGYRSPVG